MQEALIIVHLSSIDSYVDYYGVEAAQHLINDLRLAIVQHVAGPVIVMDQGWTEISEDARILRQMVLDMQAIYPALVLFHHDEMCDISPWQDGMRDLARLFRKLQVSRARLGGLWTSESGVTGCVHEVQRQLRARNIPCYVDRAICAQEENDARVSRTR